MKRRYQETEDPCASRYLYAYKSQTNCERELFEDSFKGVNYNRELFEDDRHKLELYDARMNAYKPQTNLHKVELYEDPCARTYLNACKMGHLNVVRRLLEDKSNPFEETHDGKTSLLLAIEGEHFHVAKWLWTNVNFPTRAIMQSFKHAIFHNDCKITAFYVSTTPWSIPPYFLFACALHSHVGPVKEMVSNKCLNPNIEIFRGWNTVFASLRSIPLLSFLMQKKYWNQERSNGYTLLMLAVQWNEIYTVDWLLKHKIGGNVNDVVEESDYCHRNHHQNESLNNDFSCVPPGHTAISIAVMKGYLDIARLLIVKYHGDIYLPLPENKTLLDLASPRMMPFLISCYGSPMLTCHFNSNQWNDMIALIRQRVPISKLNVIQNIQSRTQKKAVLQGMFYVYCDALESINVPKIAIPIISSYLADFIELKTNPQWTTT